MKDELNTFIGDLETVNKLLEGNENIVYYSDKRNGYGIVEYKSKYERKYNPKRHPRPGGWD